MRNGFTLIEVIFAISLSAAVAVMTILSLRNPGQAAQSNACDLRREILQDQADRYTDLTGRSPSTDLRDLRTPEYAGASIPVCPNSEENYRYVRGEVQCPSHP